MRALILTAGRGRRLRDITGELPKCLAQIGRSTLIERQLRAVRLAGITDVVVVTGYGAAEVMRVCGPGVQFVDNPRFDTTNSLYSTWLARELLQDGFVVFNCDVVFHQQLLTDLLTARHEDALLMAARGDGERYSDEEMKLRVRCGRVVDIAKTIPSARADGENVGIAKFGAAGAALLIEEMDRVVASGAVTDWLPAAFARFCRRRPLHAIDHRGFPWIEIDSPEDYRRACLQIAPAIDEPAQLRAASVATLRGDVRSRDARVISHV